MNLDLIASIEMTACAAVAIAVLAIGFGEDVSTRLRIATGLAVWFMLVTLMAATEVLHDEHGLGVPGLGIAVMTAGRGRYDPRLKPARRWCGSILTRFGRVDCSGVPTSG